jgi:hypothetical protein
MKNDTTHAKANEYAMLKAAHFQEFVSLEITATVAKQGT